MSYVLGGIFRVLDKMVTSIWEGNFKLVGVLVCCKNTWHALSFLTAMLHEFNWVPCTKNNTFRSFTYFSFLICWCNLKTDSITLSIWRRNMALEFQNLCELFRSEQSVHIFLLPSFVVYSKLILIMFYFATETIGWALGSCRCKNSEVCFCIWSHYSAFKPLTGTFPTGRCKIVWFGF